MKNSHSGPPHDPGPRRVSLMIDSGLVGSTDISFIASTGVPREQKMLKGHLPRVIYHPARPRPAPREPDEGQFHRGQYL